MTIFSNRIEASPFSEEDKKSNLKEMFEKQLRFNTETYGMLRAASNKFLEDKISSDMQSKQNSNKEKVYEKAIG